MIESVSRLELLHRVCQRKGWALLLRTPVVRDRSSLTALDVIEPLKALCPGNRRAELQRGDLIARVVLTGYVSLEQAAISIVETLSEYGMLDDLLEEEI